MSERSHVLNSQNVHTFVAVCFVLVLLSLAANFYNYARMNQIIAGMLDVEAASIRANARSEEALQRQISDMQANILQLEQGAAAQDAAPAEAAPASADPGPGKSGKRAQ